MRHPVDQYKARFRAKSNEELRHILDESRDYEHAAVQAASELLDEREASGAIQGHAADASVEPEKIPGETVYVILKIVAVVFFALGIFIAAAGVGLPAPIRVGYAIGGIVSGIVFMGFSAIVQLLGRILDRLPPNA